MDNPNQLGVQILEALGVSTKHVVGFSLNFEGGELPHATVRILIPQGIGEPALQELRKYELQLTEGSPLDSVDRSVSLSRPIETIHRPFGLHAPRCTLETETEPSSSTNLRIGTAP